MPDGLKLDAFTLNILCNPEVIAVNQDPLGKQARIVRQTRQDFILAKPLEDGSVAVGLFNLAPYPRDVSIPPAELGPDGPCKVFDLRRHEQLRAASATLRAEVARHGVRFVRLGCE